jgi:hypothetical protein
VARLFIYLLFEKDKRQRRLHGAHTPKGDIPASATATERAAHYFSCIAAADVFSFESRPCEV